MTHGIDWIFDKQEAFIGYVTSTVLVIVNPKKNDILLVMRGSLGDDKDWTI